MNLMDEIRIAQRDAGEAAVIRHLEQAGLSKVSAYATAQETASVVRKATPDELWLTAQLDRIAPDRFDTGTGDSDALVKLVFELRNERTRLDGEAGVMRDLLNDAHSVLDSIVADDESEFMHLATLKREIRAIIDRKLARKSV